MRPLTSNSRHCGLRIGDPMAKHDAFFCEVCDTWLEPPCCDGACNSGFGNRPEKPSLVEGGRRR